MNKKNFNSGFSPLKIISKLELFLLIIILSLFRKYKLINKIKNYLEKREKCGRRRIVCRGRGLGRG
jgi:hypothetical protein